MPLPAHMTALRARVEASLTAFRAVLAVRQAAHHAAQGRYWAGPLNPPVVPDNEDAGARMDAAMKVRGVDRVLPSGKRLQLDHPVTESWGDMALTLPEGAGFSVAVRSLVTPDGPGYAVVARLRLDGIEYVRVFVRGAETREADRRKIGRRR